MRRSVLLVMMAAIGVQGWAADFDRQVFLAAVKEKIEAEPGLMTSGPVLGSLLQFNGQYAGWQQNIVALPGTPIRGIRQARANQQPELKAGFSTALAYLASQELRIPFLGGPSPTDPDHGLVYVVGMGANQYFGIDATFNRFGNILLQSVFDDNNSCAIQGPVFRGTPTESQFANSICRDLKQVVADARAEFKGQQLLTSEKESARTVIQRAQNLLNQVPGYANAPAVEASITSLTASLEGNDLNEIRSNEQALVNAGRELEQIVAARQADAEALANARQAANGELTRAQDLLTHASGYSKRGHVDSAKRSLEQSLTGENTDDIKSKTQALEAADQGLDQFIRQPSTNTIAQAIASSDDDSLMAGIWLIILVVFGFFSIPTIVAFSRRHRSRWAILVLNMVLGATLIGWIIALIWALNKVDDPVKGGVKLGPAPPDPIL